jgi:hypothetical protein
MCGEGKKKPTKDEEKRRRLEEARRRLIFDPPEVPVERTVRYQQGFRALVPDEGGVYLISDLRGPLYVGRGALRSRFDKHHDESHNPRLRAALRNPVGELSFSWLTAEMPEQAGTEKRFIRALQPLCNDVMYENEN